LRDEIEKKQFQKALKTKQITIRKWWAKLIQLQTDMVNLIFRRANVKFKARKEKMRKRKEKVHQSIWKYEKAVGLKF